MMQAYDIAVIGAGVMGTNVAYQAAREHPDKRIALIDRDKIGAGCSGYAGAIISPISLTAAHQQQTALSRDWYEDPALGCQHLLRQLDTLIVYSDASQETLNQKTDLLTPVQCEVPGWLSPPSDLQLSQSRATLWGNVFEICQHLAYANDSVDVYECLAVRDFKRSNDGWQLSMSDGRTLHAGQVVVAKGAWLSAEEQSCDLIINRKKVVAYEIDAPVDETSPLVYLYDHGAFLLPLLHKQRWIMSITSQQWGCMPERNECEISQEDRQIAETILQQHAPSLIGALRGGRCHSDGYVRERRPQVVASQPGQLVIGGGSGSGFRFAPAVGRQACELLFSNSTV
ncbi:FAD-dependent oxidoreductase [Pseudoalteromonas sp. McH1-42]|uniref:NAD(P)/FAD-dependent oxidoreductase n=1 Tax=Pseudoalteromonas sp. McH1-42 TaxID=2917752 RepID=UPI001EF3DE1F|nr:FAD-dependent oxidoreductase [Pseudoalteromonas sp. McH1-42]MCG7563443.1 FAD-binding oxidoreductase [Pseudoalteromonas sp. McH1-42]